MDTFSYLGRAISSNGKIWNEINEWTKKHHLVKGLLRNKDIIKKFKLDVFKIYFKKILPHGTEMQTTNREDRKIQAMEVKFLRTI